MKEREKLIQDAKDAIDEVFSDRSVSQAETEEDLNELIGYIQTMIDTFG